MNSFRYDYAVIGGDLRQVYLASELAKEDHSICCYALCQSSKLPLTSDSSIPFASLENAVSNSRCILCPIPLSKDNTSLNQTAIKKNIPLKHLLTLLKPGQHFFAGCIPKDFWHAALEKDVRIFDFIKDAALSCFNTIATSEGIICEAIKASPINLHKSKCAVLGYGKCGRTLTNDLKNLACHVTVSSSLEEEVAQASVLAGEAFNLNLFFTRIGEYDFIFNTIPAVILTREVLRHANPSVTILDIASAPGGVDFAAAKEFSLNAKSYPGLPGRYAPLSSARFILKTIKKRSSICL